MEIWILTYIFVMNGCEITKFQLKGYKYKDKYPYKDVDCIEKGQ